jgi:hypothetical protein
MYDAYWAYFSTFGGAYSNLGEKYYDHAKNAEKLSKKQLALALKFNEPNAICRSKIFISYSYIQLGRLKEAKVILK